MTNAQASAIGLDVQESQSHDSSHNECWNHFRSFMEHEDHLIDHRLTWLATSQSIFFAGYVLQFSSDAEGQPPGVLRDGIPWFGIASCIVLSISILVAMTAWRRAKNTYVDHLRRPQEQDAARGGPVSTRPCRSLQEQITPGGTYTQVLGTASAIGMPVLFLAGWIILLFA